MNALVRGLVLVGIGALVSGSSVAQAGMLFGFDVVAGSHEFNAGQIYGRTLVAGNSTGNGGTVGSMLGRDPGNDTYVVGGNLNAGLNVQQGSVRVGGSINNSYLNMNGGGTVQSLAGFDAFDLTTPGNLQAALQTASDYFTGLTASGTYSVDRDVLTFTATPGSDGMAVFHIDVDVLANQNLKYALDLAGASTVVFNVTGDDLLSRLGNFQQSFENNAAKILWNFDTPQGAETFINRRWYGSILMPNGDLTIDNAVIGGVYVGGNFKQKGDVTQVGHRGPAASYPPPTPGDGRPPAGGDLPDREPPPGTGDAPEVATVPEPATILVFALGGLIFAGQQWRKRRPPSVAGA